MNEPLRVWIADDEPELRNLLRDALEAEGYEVEAFPDGESLLDHLEETPPDAILLDINMPGLSGWQVKERLGEDPRLLDIPVIAVTAQGGQSLETSAREALGFADFVRKPFRLEELFSSLGGLLGEVEE